MDSKNITFEQLCGLIDHTFLKPCSTKDDIEKLCTEALNYKFVMVAINPAEVETCVGLLKGSQVHTGADRIGASAGVNIVEEFKRLNRLAAII